MIDYTISIGNILQVAAFLVVGVGAFFALRADVRILRHDMKTVQQRQEVIGETLQHVATTITTVAVQHERINSLEKSVDELRHGQGFVSPMRS